MLIRFSAVKGLAAALIWVVSVTVYAQTDSLFERALLKLNRHSLVVEVASSEAAREQGLSLRSSLPDDHGMLFVFQHEEVQYFGMHNTHFNLDIAFFDRHKRLVDIAELTALDGRTTASRVPALYALEVNTGWLERHQILVGHSFALLPIPEDAQPSPRFAAATNEVALLNFYLNTPKNVVNCSN